MKSDPALPLFRAETAQVIRRELSKRGRGDLRGLRVADFGCGFGFWLGRFRQWGAYPENLFGLDLDPHRIAVAAQTLPELQFTVADARHAPFPSDGFDIVTHFTVFTSVPAQADRRQIAEEMLRVVRPGGLIVSYDFFAPNPWNARTRPFRLAEMRQCFHHCRIVLRKVTLAPPLARFALAISSGLAPALARIPLLRTHYVAIIET